MINVALAILFRIYMQLQVSSFIIILLNIRKYRFIAPRASNSRMKLVM